MARLRRVWLGLPAWLCLSSATHAASAQERSFALEWTAPAECPERALVEGYVEADVGGTVYGPTAVRASGTVLPAAGGRYTVSLELDTGGAQSSKRELVDGSCEAVSEAAALLVALAIRARAAPAPAPPMAPPPPPKAASVSHERPYLAAQVATDLGSLPVPTVGLSVGAGLTVAGLRIEPAVAYFAPQSGSVSGDANLGARFALATAGVQVCAPFPRSPLWVAPCLGGGADWIRGAGFGARVPKTTATTEAFASAAAVGGWDISSMISLRLEVMAVVPLARPGFFVEGSSDVYRRAPVALRGDFGLELHF